MKSKPIKLSKSTKKREEKVDSWKTYSGAEQYDKLYSKNIT